MHGDVFWDFDATWDVNDALSITFGGNNIFDAHPDPAPTFLTCCGVPVHPPSPMDWQGPYYYVRGAFRWN